MTLIEFNKLSLKQKSDLVWEWGYFISKNKYENYTIAVFLMDNFFAEIHFDNCNNITKRVTGIAKNELQADSISPLNKISIFL